MEIDWEGLTHARRALIGNPYQLPWADLVRAEAWFARSANVASAIQAIDELCKKSEGKTARKVVLALLHGLARSHNTTFNPPIDECVKTHAATLELRVEDLHMLIGALQRFQAAIELLVGPSEAMSYVRETLWTACFSEDLFHTLSMRRALRRQNVMILGESGTGKELIANVLLAAVLTPQSPAPKGVSINCSAIPENLAEAELFGAEKGAHSAAHERKVGKLVEASGGCLFLDEIADLSLPVQAKLLSAASNGKVTPLGSNKETSVDVRYVSATSRPIFDYVADGKFRDDLFSRLANTVIYVKPLRERREDIEAIGLSLLAEVSADADVIGVVTKLPIGGIDSPANEKSSPRASRAEQVRHWLNAEAQEQPWPGNVRTLRAAITNQMAGFREPPGEPKTSHRGLSSLWEKIFTRSQTSDDDLPTAIRDVSATEEDVQRWYFTRVLEKTRWNVSRAAEILGMDRGTVDKRIKKYGLEARKR